MNMRYVIVTGYISLLLILLYSHLSSRKIENQTPEFIKEKYKNLPKSLLEKVAIFAPFSIPLVTENDLFELFAITMLVYMLCRDSIKRANFYRNPYK